MWNIEQMLLYLLIEILVFQYFTLYSQFSNNLFENKIVIIEQETAFTGISNDGSELLQIVIPLHRQTFPACDHVSNRQTLVNG